tara:strand:+ start:1689 stop:1844 length:156 start_codon:yes stop_codon:yes gene_type:complete
MPGKEPNKEDAPYRPWGPSHPDWVPPPPTPKPKPKLAYNKFSGNKKEINDV